MERRTNWGVFLAAFVVLVSGVCTAGAADKIQYRLKLKTGEKYFIKNVNDQKITQSFMGQTQTTEQTMGFGLDMDVAAVDAAGNMDVVQKYSWVTFKQKGPMGDVVYDSAKPSGPVPAAAQSFAALLGESMTLKITPQGQVLEVGGLKKMRENVAKKLPAEQREQALAALERFLSEPMVKELTQNSMAMYPEEPVGVGDSWARKVVLSQGFAAIIESRYTVKDRKGGTATLAVASTIQPNPNGKPMEMGPMKLTYNLSGKQTGTMTLDESTGLASGKQQQEVAGQITMVATIGGESQEMNVPVAIKGTATTETTKR